MTTHDQLDRVVRDAAVPWMRVRRGGEGRHVLVWRLAALAEARLGHSSDYESDLDEFVEASGGRRLNVMDPWRVVPDLVRGVKGESTPPRDDLYELPESFFRDRGA